MPVGHRAGNRREEQRRQPLEGAARATRNASSVSDATSSGPAASANPSPRFVNQDDEQQPAEPDAQSGRRHHFGQSTHDRQSVVAEVIGVTSMKPGTHFSGHVCRGQDRRAGSFRPPAMYGGLLDLQRRAGNAATAALVGNMQRAGLPTPPATAQRHHRSAGPHKR